MFRVQAHIDYVVLRLFIARLHAVECSAAVRAALTSLCTLHAVHGIVQSAGDYLRVSSAITY
jgi:hypothetical protein